MIAYLLIGFGLGGLCGITVCSVMAAAKQADDFLENREAKITIIGEDSVNTSTRGNGTDSSSGADQSKGKTQ